jgi:predicted GNAT family acetyltransferase
VRVRRFDDAASFREETMSYLVADEARHNLLLGLSATIIEKPDLYELVDLWAVDDGREVALAALRTPPHNLVLGRPTDEDALDSLVDRLVEEGVDLPGVFAAEPESDAFAARWTTARDVDATLALRQGLYQVTTVQDVPAVGGAHREANRSDRDLVVRWMLAFSEEVLPHEPEPDRQVRLIESRLSATDSSGVWLWEIEGEPVSMSGYGGRTPNGIRIGPVYTPPDLRGRGYATALVAAQSRRLLEDGRRFVFLYTDLDNATSNALYRRIGYRLVAESADVRFDARSVA